MGSSGGVEGAGRYGRVLGSTGESPTGPAAQLSSHRGEEHLCQEVGTPLLLGLSVGGGDKPILSGVELSLGFAVVVFAVSAPPASLWSPIFLGIRSILCVHLGEGVSVPL